MKRVTKKLIAAVLTFSLLFSTTAVWADTSDGYSVTASGLTRDTGFVLRDSVIYEESQYDTRNGNFIDYWNNVIENNSLNYSNYEVNTYPVDSSVIDDTSWKEDRPVEDFYPVLLDEAYNVVSGSYVDVPAYPSDVVSGSYVDVPAYPSDVVSGSYVDVPAYPSDVVSGSYVDVPAYPSDVVSGSYVDVPAYPSDVVSGSYVDVPAYPSDVVSGSYVETGRPYYPAQNPTEVIAVPVVTDPKTVTYNVDVEVGRRVHIAPQQMTHTKLSSSDESILSAPYRREMGDYPSFAYKPGIATLSFYTEKQQFTENWNVRVYTRALDFEQKEYVTEKTGTDYEYVYLKLKNFEHSFEPAYYFEWSSSNKDVAEIYGGDSFSTFVRLRVKKQGATVVTVKDKFGNEASCVLIVRYTDKYMLDNTKISFTAKKYSQKTAKLSWKVTSDLELDGYQIVTSTNRGKTYKTIRNIKKGTTLKYNYKKMKTGKTYYFKIRGYKLVDGKKMYTPWSKVKSIVVGKKSSKNK